MIPADYRKRIADENAKWSKVIKFAGISAWLSKRQTTEPVMAGFVPSTHVSR